MISKLKQIKGKFLYLLIISCNVLKIFFLPFWPLIRGPVASHSESRESERIMKKRENVKEEGRGIELRMGGRQMIKESVVIQLRACLWRGFLSTAAKITRQELSPKVLLIAGKSHLVPQ